MAEFIVDPTDPETAISARSGKLAATVHVAPRGVIRDVAAPTVHELAQMQFVGFAEPGWV